MSTKIILEIVTGKQKKNPEKDWTGLKITVGSFKTVVFPYPSQLEKLREELGDQPVEGELK